MAGQQPEDPRGGEGGQEVGAELALAFPGTPGDTALGGASNVSVGLALHPALTQEPGAAGHRLYMLHPTLPGVLLELDSVSAPIVAFQGECAPVGLGLPAAGSPPWPNPALIAVSLQWFCWSRAATLPTYS